MVFSYWVIFKPRTGLDLVGFLIRGWNVSFKIIGGWNLSGWKQTVYTQEGSVNYNIRLQAFGQIWVGLYMGWKQSVYTQEGSVNYNIRSHGFGQIWVGFYLGWKQSVYTQEGSVNYNIRSD